MTQDPWQPLHDALNRAAARGQTVRFWLRDDDAIEPTPALDTLIDLAERHKAPVLLAVIPAHATQALATRLAQSPLVQPCQHGWCHQNHEPHGHRAAEFGAARAHADSLADLDQGRHRLAHLFGPTAPIFVPPWNRIAPEIAARLAEHGFNALSVFARKPQLAPPLPQLDCQLDLIDWKTRTGRSATWLAQETAIAIDATAPSGPAPNAPIGVLAHHLAHDTTAWTTLAQLLTLTTRHACTTWNPAWALVSSGD